MWGYINKGLSAKLQKLQNRAARIVTKDIMDELGWEVLENRRMRQLAILIYKINHGIISLTYLTNIFANVSDVHSYNIRNSLISLHFPKHKLEISKHSLYYVEDQSSGRKFLLTQEKRKA